MSIKNSQVRDILYGLRTTHGQKIILKNRTVTTDYDTGDRTTVDTVVKTIRKAIVLPELIDNSMINLLGTVIQENKGLITAGTRLVIIDGRLLHGETISIGMFANIDGIDMEISSMPIVVFNGKGYLLVFRRKA